MNEYYIGLAIGIILLTCLFAVAFKAGKKRCREERESLNELIEEAGKMEDAPARYHAERERLIALCPRLTWMQKDEYGFPKLLKENRKVSAGKYEKAMKEDIRIYRTLAKKGSRGRGLKTAMARTENSIRRYLEEAKQMTREARMMKRTSDEAERMLKEEFPYNVSVGWKSYIGSLAAEQTKGYYLMDDIKVLTLDGNYLSLSELSGGSTGIHLYPAKESEGVRLVSDTAFSVNGDGEVKEAIIQRGEYELLTAIGSIIIEID